MQTHGTKAQQKNRLNCLPTQKETRFMSVQMANIVSINKLKVKDRVCGNKAEIEGSSEKRQRSQEKGIQNSHQHSKMQISSVQRKTIQYNQFAEWELIKPSKKNGDVL